MRSFTKTVTFFLIALAGFFYESATAQSILNPNDSVVTYNSAAPPAQPANGVIGKWVRTKRVSWNTDSYKAYVYKGVPFRLKFPKTYNPTAVDGKKYPMLAFFHGLGETGTIYDNEYSLYHGAQNFMTAVDNGKFDGYVIVFQSPSGWGAQQYSALTEIINYMAINNKLSPFQVTVNGLSAGGYASWDAMIDYMPYIAQAIPMSGISIGHLDAAKIQKYKFTPISYFQGGLDGSPAPYTAQQVVNAVNAAGGNLKYKVYSTLGHGTWDSVWAEPDFYPSLNRAYSSNPWTLFGRTEFCPGDPINVTVGVQPGFAGYQWRKDNVAMAATTNSIQVTTPGVYQARVLLNGIWSDWSPVPVAIKIKAPTVTPPITVTGVMSRVLPALDTNSVTLRLPSGYVSYTWQKQGSSTVLSTDSTLQVSAPGNYVAKVTELYGCSSDFSPAFTVVDANGTNRPDAAINLTVKTLSKTSLQLDWSDNPSPQYNETNFEIYQAPAAAGPYKIVGLTGQDVVTLVLNGLNSNTKYYYKVRAVNNTAASAANSNVAFGTTASDVQNPTAPDSLTVVNSTRNSVSLKWKASTDDVGVARYEIYVNGLKSYTTTATQFTVSSLETGANYNFTVRAKDLSGNSSAFSNQVTAQAVVRGFNYKYFEGTWSVLPNFTTLTPVKSGNVTNISLVPRNRDVNMGFLFEGFITIPAAGSYTFRLNSDDGSRMYLGSLNGTTSPYSFSGTPFIDNDGLHGAQNRDVTVTLAKGTYPVAVTFFNQGGGFSVSLSWTTPSSSTFTAIPDASFIDQSAVVGTAPAVPSSLTATTSSYNKINLTWTDNSNNESGFEIYRASSLNGVYSIIGSAAANSTTYTDSTLAASTSYFYKIRAIGNYGESALIYQNVEASWSLDNNYNDTSGFNRTLIQTGGPTFDAASKQEGSHAIKLNGTTQSLLINTDDGYLKNTYSEKTVAFWMKPTLNVGNKMVFDLGGNDDGIALSVNTTNLIITTTTAINVGIASNNVRRSFTANFSSTNWTHVAVVYNKNTIRLYLNGVEAGSITDLAFSSVGVTTNGSRIGFHEGNNALNVTPVRFVGSLDNFTIYGTALTPEAIAAHMNDVIVQSNAKTLSLPVLPNTPTNLVATATGTSSVNVKWKYNGVNSNTTTIPAGTTRTEAEAYTTMTGIATETCSEGGLDVKSIDANDWMDYTVNVPVAGTCTVNFRVATNVVATGQFQLRTSDEQILATFNIPKTATTQVFSTVSATVTLPAGTQTLRVYALKNGWTFNWFEIATGSNTSTTSTTANASAFEVYRSANVNTNYVLLSTVSGTDSTFVDSGLFANSVFYYKVNAVSLGGSSAASNEDSALTGNTAPIIDSIATKAVRYGTTVNIPISGSDVDGGSLTFIVNNKPAFATLVNNGDNKATLTVSPLAANIGTYSDVTVIAKDANGGSDTTKFNLVVNDNFSPVIDTINNYSVGENETLDISITGSDLNPADSLSWSANSLPDTYSITSTVNGTAVLHIKPGFAAAGEYNVNVVVDDNKGGTSTRQFKLTVGDRDPSTVIYARVKADNDMGAPWNNLTGVNTSNLKDRLNNVTPVGISFLPNTWWGGVSGGASTYNNSGVYPDAVLRDYHYFGIFGGPETDTLLITGLNPAQKQNLTIFASSTFDWVPDNGNTTYTVGDQTVSLYVQKNTQNTVSLNNITPSADGSIKITMKKAANAPVGYFNSIVITSLFNDSTAPAAPKLLAAQLAPKGVKLTWQDPAYNETGYEVYRSNSEAGAYTMVASSNGANITEALDSTVAGATTYFYKIRYTNSYGVSPYTNVVTVSTINRIPSLTALSNVTVKNDQTLVVNVVAADDATDNVTLTATGLPSFATFVDNGNGTGAINIHPGAGSVGVYSGIQVTATDNSGANSQQSFNIFVVDSKISYTYINFTDYPTNTLAEKPWNNLSTFGYAGTTISNLKDDGDLSTSVSLTLTDGWQWITSTGMRPRNGTELFPEVVNRNSLYITDAANHRMTISGLSSSKKYNFLFFNSHDDGANVTTNFTINGVTVTNNASYNVNKTVQLNGISPDASGKVVITVAKGANATYGMLAAMIIETYDPAVISLIGPADLRVKSSERDWVSLQWQDRADSESGYEIWRAADGSSSYALIATVGANVTSYKDSALAVNKGYSYTVRAKAGANYTSYSNAVRGYTYSSIIRISLGSPAYTVPTPWNNLNTIPEVGYVWNGFKDQTNNSTSVGMVETGLWAGLYTGGFRTGNNSGVVPDNVSAEGYVLFPGQTSSLKLTGLNLNKKYDLTFYASSTNTYTANALYTVNGKTSVLNASNNFNGTTTIFGISPDENGEIVVQSTTYEGAELSVLSALIINDYNGSDISPLQPPVSGGSNVRIAGIAEVLIADAATTQRNLALSAYPNPFVDNLIVSVPAASHDNIQVSLTDINGKLIYMKRHDNLNEGNNIIRIQNDRGAMVPGVYILRVLYVNKNEQKFIKVIKQ